MSLRFPGHRRSPNFSLAEKVLVLEIISRYDDVIEGVRWGSKKDVWSQITEEYNAATPSGIQRDLTQLKNLYKNMKKYFNKKMLTGKISDDPHGLEWKVHGLLSKLKAFGQSDESI